MSDAPKDPIIERHCTKEHPWDRTPFEESEIRIIHDDAEEIWEDLTGRFVDYWCPNCGQIIEKDYGPDEMPPAAP